MTDRRQLLAAAGIALSAPSLLTGCSLFHRKETVKRCTGRYVMMPLDGTPVMGMYVFENRAVSGQFLTFFDRTKTKVTFRVSETKDGARLEENGKPDVTAATSAELMQKSQGYPLPVGSLQYWLLGLEDPSMPARPIQGQMKTAFAQGNWDVTVSLKKNDIPYVVYLKHFPNIDAPNAEPDFVLQFTESWEVVEE